MTIVAERRELAKAEIRRRVIQLARALYEERLNEITPSASFLVGAHWDQATAKQGPDDAEETQKTRNTKPKRVDPAELVDVVTRKILLGTQSGVPIDARPPSTWLKHKLLAPVTGGPVAVPPLTAALIEHWCATTLPQNEFTPVHPFLYGILPDEEGTPLIGIAFRLEMDVLATLRAGEEDADGQSIRAQVEEILTSFPPLRSELHLVPISLARKWFAASESSEVPVASFDGEEWQVRLDHPGTATLRPDTILILPTMARSRNGVEELLEDTGDIATRDVLMGVATHRPSYWRQVVEVHPGDHRLSSDNGASRFEPVNPLDRAPPAPSENASIGDTPPDPPAGKEWRRQLSRSFEIGSASFRFVYLKAKSQVRPRQFLRTHLELAQSEGARVAQAVAPESEFLRSLLSEAAVAHDTGKANPKWQSAMGNGDLANPVAKPVVERPGRTGGFRHEWESFLRAVGRHSPKVPIALSESGKQVWMDLWQHLIASHHGHVRPWIADHILEKHPVPIRLQSVLRVQSAERFSRLQHLLGPWRLAYLEALLKAADATASLPSEGGDADEQ